MYLILKAARNWFLRVITFINLFQTPMHKEAEIMFRLEQLLHIMFMFRSSKNVQFLRQWQSRRHACLLLSKFFSNSHSAVLFWLEYSNLCCHVDCRQSYRMSELHENIQKCNSLKLTYGTGPLSSRRLAITYSL